MDELFSQRLTQLIQNTDCRLDDLEKAVGKTSATISRYASGEIKGVKRSTIVALANFFGVSPAWLSGLSDEKYLSSSTQTIPLYNSIKTKANYLSNENIIEYINLEKKFLDPENYFALKVSDDSMKPFVSKNDILIIHKQNNIESNGKIALLIIDNIVTVKKVILKNDTFELYSLNPYYPNQTISKDKVEIIGQVVSAIIYDIFD